MRENISEDKRFIKIILPLYNGTVSELLPVSEEGQLIVEQSERATVKPCGAKSGNGITVGFGRVAFVDLPSIARTLVGQSAHCFVAVGLCKDRGGGNVGEPSVAFDKRGPRDLAVGGESVAVDYYGFRPQFESVERAMHGKNGCAQNIDPVNFFIIDNSDGPCESLVFNDGAKLVATFLADLFRIIEPRMAESSGKDNRGGVDRTGQTASSGFVATGFNDVRIKTIREGAGSRFL